MEKRFELMVFDWDGTLMDSAGFIASCIQAACRDLDIPEPGEERARHVIGLGLGEALAHAVPGLPEERYPQLVGRYRHHYLSRDHEIDLFAGAEELIAGLSRAGVRLAVATGKSRVGLDRVLAATGLGAYFDATRTADETFSKPHPAMLLELMDELDANPETTLMVGDTTHDLLMAQNAGVSAAAVAFGAHPESNLLEFSPLICAREFSELAAWLTARA